MIRFYARLSVFNEVATFYRLRANDVSIICLLVLVQSPVCLAFLVVLPLPWEEWEEQLKDSAFRLAGFLMILV